MQTDANPTPTTEFFFDELEYIIMTILIIDGLRVDIFFIYVYIFDGAGFNSYRNKYMVYCKGGAVSSFQVLKYEWTWEVACHQGQYL